MDELKNTSIIESKNVRRLRQDEILFSQVSFDGEDTITFWIVSTFNVSEILGVPSSSDDRVTAAAHYDIPRRASFNTLDVSILTVNGDAYAYRYLLTGDERVRLAQRMEAYYKRTTGVSLEQVCREISHGMVPPPRARK